MNKKTTALAIASILGIGGALSFGVIKGMTNSISQADYVDREVDFASLIAEKLTTNPYSGKLTVSKNSVSYTFGVKNVYTDTAKKSIYLKDGCILNCTAINGMTGFSASSDTSGIDSFITTTFKDMYDETEINFTDGTVMNGLTAPEDIDFGWYTHFLISNSTDTPVVINKLQVAYSCENGGWTNVDTDSFDVSSDIDIGQGTSTNPYEIKTEFDYHDYGQKVSNGTLPSDTCFVLKNNINVHEQFITGNAKYEGTFDGGDNAISYYPDYEGANPTNVGMFNELENASIKDLKVVGVFSAKGESTMYVGAIASKSTNSTFDNVYVDVDIMGRFMVGGLVGADKGGLYNNCTYDGIIDGDYILYAGGMVGKGQNIQINGSTFGGIIYSQQLAGGIIGELEGGYISGCSETSSGQVLAPVNTGGIVGYGFGELQIYNCSAAGYVVAFEGLTAHSNTGGIVGRYSSSLTISYCNVTGTVKGWENIGGIVGWSESEIRNCSFTGGTITGDICLGGIVGLTSNTVRYCSVGTETNPIILSGDDSLRYAGGIVGKTSADISKCNAYVTIDPYIVDNAIELTGGIVGAVESENDVSIHDVYVDSVWNKSTDDFGVESNQYVGFYCGQKVTDNVEFTYLLESPNTDIETVPQTI